MHTHSISYYDSHPYFLPRRYHHDGVHHLDLPGPYHGSRPSLLLWPRCRGDARSPQEGAQARNLPHFTKSSNALLAALTGPIKFSESFETMVLFFV